MKLKGRVAIVTGGASGIGKSIVRKFAEARAAGIVIADVNGKTVQEVAHQIAQAQGESQALGILTDVSSPDITSYIHKQLCNETSG